MRALGEWKLSGQYAKRYGTESLRVLFVVAPNDRDPHRLGRIKRWCEAFQLTGAPGKNAFALELDRHIATGTVFGGRSPIGSPQLDLRSYNTGMVPRMFWKVFGLLLAMLILLGIITFILTVLGLNAVGGGRW